LSTPAQLRRNLTAGGSPDPDKNAQLATVVKKYKEQGVPKDNIERALAKVCWSLSVATVVVLLVLTGAFILAFTGEGRKRKGWWGCGI
jgi:hypothetical protein